MFYPAAIVGVWVLRMRNWVKTAFFLSALSPALLSIAASRYWANGFEWEILYYGLIGLLGILVTALIIQAIRRYGELMPFTAKKIESSDVLMLGVVLTYFFPFIGKASDISPKLVIVLFSIVAIVLWFSSAVLPSPLLRLFRYRFYKVESANGVVYTLITQRDLLDPSQIKSVKKISESMLVEIA